MMKAPHSRCEGLFTALSLFILRFIVFIILSDVRLGVLIHIRLFLVRHAFDDNLYSFFPFIFLKGQNPQESYPINYIKNPLGR